MKGLCDINSRVVCADKTQSLLIKLYIKSSIIVVLILKYLSFNNCLASVYITNKSEMNNSNHSTKISKLVADQLDKIAKSEGFIDYEIEQEPGSKHGDGFVATMLAVTLIGNRKIGNVETESKLHLMCKMLPENKKRRETFESSTIFEREIFIYNKILSTFNQFQCEKNIPIENRFIEYPKCYAAISDMDNEEDVIIMENLKSIGYGFWDKTKPIDYDTVCLYMEALGKLHALSFAIRDQKPQLFDELSDFENLMTKMMEPEKNSFIAMMVSTYDKAISLLDQPDELKVMQHIRDHYKEELLRLLDKKSAGNFYVISHGDSWNNNLFFSNEGSVRYNVNSVREIRLIVFLNIFLVETEKDSPVRLANQCMCFAWFGYRLLFNVVDKQRNS